MKAPSKIKQLLVALALSTPLLTLAADITLLNVSYDPTRELYVEFNKAFGYYW
jgi:sulfate transport system substrate-binding protein